ncbi:MAG: EboA domain-containing protein [Planctomycetota bacterium]
MDAPFPTPFAPLLARLGDGAAWLQQAAAAIAADRRELAVAFPQLPRRLGRSALAPDATGSAVETVGPARCDLAGWRRCDAGAALLLAGAAVTDDELRDLYAHGDLEERVMVLRALATLPVTAATADLLGEVQRTNMVLHVEAAVCDSDLLVRAAGAGVRGFGTAEQNALLLKVAFLDLPAARVFDAATRANPELSRMLQDLATEREAAGRAIWRDTDRFLCRAPVPGSVARILGGLEHGDDGRRQAAAEALAALNRPELRPFAQERLPREPRPAIRAVLQRVTR